MKKYYLTCTVYFSNQEDGLTLLYSSEIYTNDINQVQKIYDSFNWTEVQDEEYISDVPRIKYAITIFATDKKDDLVFLKEKYFLLNLQDFNSEFWSVFNGLNVRNV